MIESDIKLFNFAAMRWRDFVNGCTLKMFSISKVRLKMILYIYFCQLRDKCTIIPSMDKETLREWLVTVFENEENGYQPLGDGM